MKPKTNQLLQKVQLDFLQTKNKEYTIQLLLIPLTISLTIITGTFQIRFLREVDVDALRRLIKMKLEKVVLFIHLKIIYIVKIQLHLTLNHFIKEMMTGLNVNLGNSHYHPFILSNQITTIQIHIIVAIPKKMFSPKKYLYHHQMSPNFLLQKDESLWIVDQIVDLDSV